MFNLTWRVKSQSLTTEDGSESFCLIRAPLRSEVYGKTKKLGIDRPRVDVDLNATFNDGFGLSGSDRIDLREKANLYEMLGRRLKMDSDFSRAIASSIEFIEDEALKGAVTLWRQQIEVGVPLDRAMINAGFPVKDAMIVKSLAVSGNTRKAFDDMAQSAKREYEQKRDLKALFRVPKILIFMFFAFSLAFVFFTGKNASKFYAQMNYEATMPTWVTSIYEFVSWSNENMVSSILLFGAMAVAVLFVWNSSLVRSQVRRFKTFYHLILKAEHANVWSSYALMYDSGIPPEEACEHLSKSCKLPETKRALLRMQKELAAGQTDYVAVMKAGFPKFIVSGYRGARESGSLTEGLDSFVSRLNDDVIVLTRKSKELTGSLTMYFGGVMVLLMFGLTYLPLVVPAMINF